MSIEGIERFNLRNEGFEIPVSDGEWMRYSDHERIVKELEARNLSIIDAVKDLRRSSLWNADGYDAALSGLIKTLLRDRDVDKFEKASSEFVAAVQAANGTQPSLSDAIREVEQMRDEKGASLGDEDLVTHLAAEGDIRLLDEVVARLRSLGTQTQDWK